MPQLKNIEAKREVPAITTWSYGSHAIRGERWRYIRYYDGSEELYDGENDFGEHNNLAGDPKYAEVIAKMKKHIPEDIYKPTEKNVEFHAYSSRAEKWKKDPSLVPDWLK